MSLPPQPAMPPGRAENIRALLQNPLLEEVLAGIEIDALTTWRASDNQAQRDAQWYLVKATEKVRQKLQALENEVAAATHAATQAKRR